MPELLLATIVLALHFQNLVTLFIAELAWLLVRSRSLLVGLFAFTNLILIAWLVAEDEVELSQRWRYAREDTMPVLLVFCCAAAVLDNATREQSISILMPNFFLAALSISYSSDWVYCFEVVAPNIITVAAMGGNAIWTRRHKSLLWGVAGSAVVFVWAITLFQSLF